MTPDASKNSSVLTCGFSAIVVVFSGRLLFSDTQVVRLAGAVLVIVSGSLFLISCWWLFRSKSS